MNNKKLFVVMLLLSFSGWTQNIATDKFTNNKFQTIKKKSVPWFSKQGMSSLIFQNEINIQNDRGYQLQYVRGYNVTGEAKYNAIWEKRSGSPLSTRYGMTAKVYQKEFDRHVAQGFRLKLVSGYTVNGADLYAAIWDKSSGPSKWYARHGLSSNQYQAAFDKYVSMGYRLVHVSGYGAPGAERFAGIWYKTSGPLWYASHGLSKSQFDSISVNKKSNGYQLKKLENYSIADQTKYVALWEKSESGEDDSFTLSGNRYQTLFDNYFLKDLEK